MTKSLSVVKRNHLYCFDMVSGVLIYDVEISPTTRVLQVTQDSILLDTNYNHSENNILRTDKKNLTIPGAFAIDDNYVYYSYCASNDIINKTNTEYCKYNLQDGSKISVESNSCYNSTTFTNNVVFYISDKGFVSKDGGEIIQNNLGDLNLLNEQSNCYNLLFRYYQNSNSVSYGNIIVNVEPCPTYSIKRSGELSFDITMTNAGIDKIIQGNAYLVGCDDTGELPIFTQLNQKYELVLASNGKCSFTISKDYLNSTKSKYFALIIETNGLLDTTNSELSDFDKKNKPLFDGTSISYDEQKSVVVTVWENK